MWRRLAVIGAVAVLAASVVGCGDDDGADDEAAGTSAVASTTVPSSTTTAGRTAAVRVYFARDEGVAVAGATVTAPAVARGAMEALLAGPGPFEAEIGLGTEVPAGTELLGIAVEDGTATVDLSGDFESGGGSLSMQLRVAQVVFTLTQFPTVETVTIELDSEAVEAIGGEGVPARDLDRGDVEAVTPFILVETPAPGAEVGPTVEVRGIANTFEANVRYSAVDGDGRIVDEGFTTATAGNGTWGDFSFTADLAGARPGLGAVIVFQEDAATGDQVDVYEVPVRIG